MKSDQVKLTSAQIRSWFLAFFANKKRGSHTVIPSASLVTPDEKGVTNPTLFNTAGMQPLIPYLLGKPFIDSKGREVTRLVDVQKVLRTVDIDDIGDKTHVTFFEMLGNWSLGDYFKKEAIEWSYEFLTSPTEASEGEAGLGLDPRRLYVTVFEGDANAPRDDEAAAIWHDVFKKHGIDAGGDTSKGEAGRIFYLPAKNNWWEAGDNGPCGPDTEMFYDVGSVASPDGKFSGCTLTHDEYVAADDIRDVIEIWNDVFMQYEKKDGKIIGTLPKPSVDTGAGLERLTMTIQGVDNVYDTDLLKSVIDKIREHSKNWNLKSARIVADHIRASVFIIADGIKPSENARGYIPRKLIRRASMHADKMSLSLSAHDLVDTIINIYSSVEDYKNLREKSEEIKEIIKNEELKFLRTLGILKQKFNEIIRLKFIFKKLESLDNISETDKKIFGHYFDVEFFTKNNELKLNKQIVFDFYQSQGAPFELIEEFARENNILIDKKDFEKRKTEHQDLSRAGAEQKFKGGLADANDPVVVRYHTATHLLHQALHDVLDDKSGESGIEQKGSNITAERLRFDFSFPRKMTDEEKKRVEDIVNEKIAAKLPVQHVVMPRAEAEKTGARHFFNEKYGEEISIYFIGADLAHAYSKEFCGGPHVANTSELAGPDGLARFKIAKEEAVSQGVRRIKAVLVK